MNGYEFHRQNGQQNFDSVINGLTPPNQTPPPPKRMIYDNEFYDLTDFVKNEDLSSENILEQLRCLWTAWCIHKMVEVDTSLYDSALEFLYIKGANKYFKSLVDFDGYMCRWLV